MSTQELAEGSAPAGPAQSQRRLRQAESTHAPSDSPEAITQDMIAKHAYEISQSEEAGTDVENWVRAERELMAE